MGDPESKKTDEELPGIGRIDELAQHPDADLLEELLGGSARRIRRASEKLGENPDEELQ